MPFRLASRCPPAPHAFTHAPRHYERTDARRRPSSCPRLATRFIARHVMSPRVLLALHIDDAYVISHNIYVEFRAEVCAARWRPPANMARRRFRHACSTRERQMLLFYAAGYGVEGVEMAAKSSALLARQRFMIVRHLHAVMIYLHTFTRPMLPAHSIRGASLLFIGAAIAQMFCRAIQMSLLIC